MNRPLQKVRPLLLRLRAQRRAEVDGDRGDEGDRQDDGTDHDDCADDATRRASDAMSEEAPEHYSTVINTACASTVIPSVTRTSATRPSFGARSSFSIFIASTTTRPCRAVTTSPALTSTLT